MLLRGRDETTPVFVPGFQIGDYEECRLLGYKNPVRTLTGNTLRLR
jgi:hypothetical protein